MHIAPPKTKPTGPQITDDLADAIHEHRLPPGTKLGEDELSDVYGVSRTVIRTALLSLSHQRLITVERNKGAFVAKPSTQEAREVFEARALLEPRTVRSAAERIDQAGLIRLQSHIDEEHAAMAAGKSGRAVHLSGLFHIEIARIAQQETILAFIEQLVARSSLIIALYWRRPAALCERHAHDALLRALRTGNGADAEELMKMHLLDILSSLNLRDAAEAPTSLRDALGPR
ncbi:GntR family transcriptional regulator [Thioclava sp. SK-1]|uniref:GntR family transcriptional regulator n=1 Tax=Thioclava sp. SK-1 TaxID=1889770 RepID=UPI0008248A3E|nr:GntR family transcriptional regulator [Thioclava sp. SK-1]OCX66806.1 GntR family transcriptional regulator [Thioclava sp. SK-1]